MLLLEKPITPLLLHCTPFLMSLVGNSLFAPPPSSRFISLTDFAAIQLTLPVGNQNQIKRNHTTSFYRRGKRIRMTGHANSEQRLRTQMKM